MIVEYINITKKIDEIIDSGNVDSISLDIEEWQEFIKDKEQIIRKKGEIQLGCAYRYNGIKLFLQEE